MKLLKVCVNISFLLMAGFFPLRLAAQNSASGLETGLNFYRQGNYQQAQVYFLDQLNRQNDIRLRGDIYPWAIKSSIAMADFARADQLVDQYLLNNQDHAAYSEIYYLKGKLLFLMQRYEDAIICGYGFIEMFPNSDFIGNCYFWIAESFYHIGQFQNAHKLYQYIVVYYPHSYKVEAARYKMQLIEEKYRQQALLELLKDRHKAYLNSLENAKLNQMEMLQALNHYQNPQSESFNPNPLSLPDPESPETYNRSAANQTTEAETNSLSAVTQDSTETDVNYELYSPSEFRQLRDRVMNLQPIYEESPNVDLIDTPTENR